MAESSRENDLAHHRGSSFNRDRNKPFSVLEDKQGSLKTKDPEKNKPPRHSLLDREFDIKFKPRTFIRGGILVFIFIAVFFLGRLSASDVSVTISADSFVPDFLTGLLNYFSEFEVEEENNTTAGIVADMTTEPETDSDSVNSSTLSADTAADTAGSDEEVIEEAAAAEGTEDEPVVTTYSKVSMALTDVDFDWKGTWGKITRLGYTIKNNEAGTVKPDYFILMVEGYPDEGSKKKVPLPRSSKTVKSGISVSSKATVPNGFAYNELETGDLTSVLVTVTLYDANGKQITSFNKNFALNG